MPSPHYIHCPSAVDLVWVRLFYIDVAIAGFKVNILLTQKTINKKFFAYCFLISDRENSPCWTQGIRQIQTDNNDIHF